MTKTLTALALILTASVATSANATTFEGCTNAVPVMSTLNPGTVLYWTADCGYPARSGSDQARDIAQEIIQEELRSQEDLNGDGQIG